MNTYLRCAHAVVQAWSQLRTHAVVHACRILIIAACAAALGGCPSDDPAGPTNDSGKITIKDMVEAVRTTVPASGGVVRVVKEGSPIDGLVITVPSGAVASAAEFTVSSAEITGHQFGSSFHPVTPLLKIENGGGWSARTMTLRIPVPAASAGAGLMAFYYDAAKGTLEGIPTLRRGAGFLEVAVRHFSLIVVSDFQKELLEGGGGFDTFFEPEENGWSFVNYGSAVTDGNCAGMCIGAAYFYRNFSSTLRVASHFDNSALWFPTPEIWQDDATALKFVTELQHAFVSTNWNTDGVVDTLAKASAEEHFWNICYGLLVLNQPQPLYVDHTTDPSAGAHAILAFGYDITATEGRIHVYDPNYPGRKGTVRFDRATGQFDAYTSSTNASALEQGFVYNYNRVLYTPLSTIAPLADVDRIWAKVAAGSIGKGVLPEYTVYARSASDPTGPRVELLDVTKMNTMYLPFSDVEFVVEPKTPGTVLALATFEEIPSIHEFEIRDPAGVVELDATSKLIGVWVKGKEPVKGAMQWAGWHWYKLALSTFWIDPMLATGGVNQDIEFTVRSAGEKPTRARYEWDFGDGTGVVKVDGDSSVAHTYKEAGEITVTCTVVDAAKNETVAKVTGRAVVSRYVKFMIDLKGMDAGDATSALVSTENEPIPDVICSNYGSEVYGPLVWDGMNFSASYSWNMVGTAYTGTVSGTLSADGKRVVSMQAEAHGVYGDWTSDIRIGVRDFPIEEMVGMGITGAVLSGPTVQSKLTDVVYQMHSGTPPKLITGLGSINYNHPKLRLYVYFYEK